MIEKINKENCLYQDDVVDLIIKSKLEKILKTNPDGNLVLGNEILKIFEKETSDKIVWVLSERYWRKRVFEDAEGRKADG